MKTTIRLFVFVSCVTLSCKRPTAERVWTGYIVARIDSVETSFPLQVGVVNQYSSISNNFNLRVSAYDERGINQIEFTVSNLTGIVVGRYCSDGSAGNNTARLMYWQNPTNWPFASTHNRSNPATVTLNALSAEAIQGDFAGDLYLLEYREPNVVSTTIKKIVTNGRFDLKLK